MTSLEKMLGGGILGIDEYITHSRQGNMKPNLLYELARAMNQGEALVFLSMN